MDLESLERTSWFYCKFQKPFYEGVYEVEPYKGCNVIFYSYWNGLFWNLTSNTIKRALDYKDFPVESESMKIESKWRGLTTNQGKVQRSYFMYIPQNTGWSGGSSWFDTYSNCRSSNSCKNLEEAESINSIHKDKMNDPNIKYRVVLKEIKETHYYKD